MALPANSASVRTFVRTVPCAERGLRLHEPSRYDEKLALILRQSAGVFAARGFHRASIRDISAATKVSLSGLYYYFNSKEELLFLIQRHCFQSLMDDVVAALEDVTDPEERLRTLIEVHLGFFVANMEEMKVLSHEADALTGEYAAEVLELKRRYVALARSCVEPLLPEEGGADVRVATFALFGQMNWLYNWYRPGRDPDAASLARQMADLYLSGVTGSAAGTAAVTDAAPAMEAAPATETVPAADMSVDDSTADEDESVSTEERSGV
jgi:AcrR family transcriptional regulator